MRTKAMQLLAVNTSVLLGVYDIITENSTQIFLQKNY